MVFATAALQRHMQGGMEAGWSESFESLGGDPVRTGAEWQGSPVCARDAPFPGVRGAGA